MIDPRLLVSGFRDARYEAAMLGLVVLFTAVEIALILFRLDGHFSYTLDDPYIHLALSDQIARGHYGLNPGEAASPSSSILYPFLLAGVSIFGLGQFGPLFVGFAATLASGWLLCRILREVLPLDAMPVAGFAALAASFLLSCNLIGLELTGLEHSLHVAVTLACLLGGLRFLRTGRVAAWWWLSALAEPLIRYEGASLWVATAVLMAVHRRSAAACALLFAGLATILGFSAALHGLGLPLLPSSVLIKSNATGAGTPFPDVGPFEHILLALRSNLTSPGAPPVLALTALLVWIVVRCWRAGDIRGHAAQLAVLALGVTGAHLVFGRFDAFSRYEIYLLVLDSVVVVVGFAPAIARLMGGAPPVRCCIAALVALVLMRYDAGRSWESFLAAQNVYDQQFQMHRMAADFYKGPVAVNDLGWVSFRNPFYVLDLWGLGSEEARLARRADASGLWMDSLARKHDVGLAMIYDRWFPHVPPQWRPVAILTFDAAWESAAQPRVTFYATRADNISFVRAAAEELRKTLPANVALEFPDKG